ncbi:energy transducer TonB [Flavitalea sp.]|nr:energy transducer TonB [Flavitalea sp.]
MTNLAKLRISLTIIILSFISTGAKAQTPKLTRYFDSLWAPANKGSAFFYTEMEKVSAGYNCVSYWVRSGKLNCKSFYNDTIFSKASGLLLRYYETGQTEDSTIYNGDGILNDTYHYYPDGKLHVHHRINPKSKKSITEAFDVKGRLIEDFVFIEEASFSTGAADWKAYLNDNIQTRNLIKLGAPPGSYELRVRFMINKNGKPVNVEAINTPGYGMEEEARRLVMKSPKWKPAIYLNKPVEAWFIQPVVIIIKDETKEEKQSRKTAS